LKQIASLVVAAFLIAALCQHKAFASESPTIDAALNWLPARTVEAYAYNGPVEFSQLKQLRPADVEQMKFDDYLSSSLYAPLVEFNLSRNSPAEHNPLLGKTLKYAIKGTQPFQVAGNRGGINTYWQNVYVVVFEEPIQSEVITALQAYKKIDTADGAIWESTKNVRSDKNLRAYIAAPKEHTILLSVSNNSNLLQWAVRRVKSNSKDCSIPATVPGWRYIDKHSKFWALAQFPQNVGFKLARSPFTIYHDTDFDHTALCMAGQYDPGKSKFFQAIYFSTSTDALNLTKQRFRDCMPGSERYLKISSVDAKTTSIAFQFTGKFMNDYPTLMATLQAIVCHEALAE
jgi:hypothetical protein